MLGPSLAPGPAHQWTLTASRLCVPVHTANVTYLVSLSVSTVTSVITRFTCALSISKEGGWTMVATSISRCGSLDSEG